MIKKNNTDEFYKKEMEFLRLIQHKTIEMGFNYLATLEDTEDTFKLCISNDPNGKDVVIGIAISYPKLVTTIEIGIYHKEEIIYCTKLINKKQTIDFLDHFKEQIETDGLKNHIEFIKRFKEYFNPSDY